MIGIAICLETPDAIHGQLGKISLNEDWTRLVRTLFEGNSPNTKTMFRAKSSHDIRDIHECIVCQVASDCKILH
jgi:hypothetical protein